MIFEIVIRIKIMTGLYLRSDYSLATMLPWTSLLDVAGESSPTPQRPPSSPRRPSDSALCPCPAVRVLGAPSPAWRLSLIPIKMCPSLVELRPGSNQVWVENKQIHYFSLIGRITLLYEIFLSTVSLFSDILMELF